MPRSGGHRHRRPRHRRRGREPRHQLRSPQRPRELRPPHRPHRARAVRTGSPSRSATTRRRPTFGISSAPRARRSPSAPSPRASTRRPARKRPRPRRPRSVVRRPRASVPASARVSVPAADAPASAVVPAAVAAARAVAASPAVRPVPAVRRKDAAIVRRKGRAVAPVPTSAATPALRARVNARAAAAAAAAMPPAKVAPSAGSTASRVPDPNRSQTVEFARHDAAPDRPGRRFRLSPRPGRILLTDDPAPSQPLAGISAREAWACVSNCTGIRVATGAGASESRNGNVIADSAEGYARREDCEHGITLVKGSADASIVDMTLKIA